MDGGYTQVSNIDLPAGYTYFAQFVFHDLTLGHLPRLDLRNLYGAGPKQDSRYYNSQRPWCLLEGRSLDGGDVHDLPRNPRGLASIPDKRDDRTIMLGQIHAAFVHLHNTTAQSLRSTSPWHRFEEARRRIVDLYRSLVSHDLLPRLVADPDRVLQAGPANHVGLGLPISQAFSLAVARVGHAMAKPRYRLNDRLEAVLLGESPPDAAYADLRGQPLDVRAVIGWEYFFPVGKPMNMQRAARINASVCHPLFHAPLPGNRTGSVPYLTLTAGERAGLLSGQVMASALGYAPLPPELVWDGLDVPAEVGGLDAPFWCYVLREADIQQHGRRLGEVGSAILETVIHAAMLSGAAEAFPHASASGRNPPTATVGDLLATIVGGGAQLA